MNHQELASKHQKIRVWLESIFVDNNIPQYEINEETIDYLYKLYKHQQKMDHLTKLQIDDGVLKTKELRSEASRLQEIIDSVGLSVYTLSNSGKSNLKMLTDVALALEIKDVKKSSYCLALYDLNQQITLLTNEVAAKQRDLNKLIKQTENSLKHLEKITIYYEEASNNSTVDTPVRDKRIKECESLRSKSQKYQSQIREFEKDQQFQHIDKQLHHEALVKLSEQLEELKTELQPLQKKFQSYRSLPPDINLAKVKIEEAKRELSKLDSKLQTDIDLLNL